MNPLRSIRTPDGDAQMAQIWTKQVPQRLISLPLDRPVINLPRDVRRSPAETRQTALRLSTRSAPDAAAPEPSAVARRYVRAATFQDPSRAKAAARRLAATGLPVRLGTVSRKGQPYKVVLAGPFHSGEQASAALAKARVCRLRQSQAEQIGLHCPVQDWKAGLQVGLFPGTVKRPHQLRLVMASYSWHVKVTADRGMTSGGGPKLPCSSSSMAWATASGSTPPRVRISSIIGLP